MKPLLMALACLPLMHAHAQKNTAADKRLAGIDSVLQRVLASSKASSFAVAVVEKNKVIYAKGFGYRDAEKKLPANENTLYAIGSCSKAFTSELIGLLEKDGKVELDKPVTTYLPALHFYNKSLTDQVTLRDMMSHRTGLPRHDLSWYLFPTDNRDSLLQRIQFQEPTYGLREKWQYNNFMFFAQGMVAEKITGKSWEENIREKLFVPLGMKSSNMPYSAVKSDPNLAVPYYLKKDSTLQKLPHYNIGSMAPAGAIYSTVTDMSHWVITWINGGKYEGKEIIPASYIKQAAGSQMVIEADMPDTEKPDLMFANYGFGWFVSSYKSHYLVEHGGNIDGFSASTSYFPTDSIGIIVLTNQNGSWVPSITRNILADRMLNLPKFDWINDRVASINKRKKSMEDEKKTVSSSHKSGTKPSHALTDFAGLFSHPGYGTLEVICQRDSLFAKTTLKNIWLEHLHYDVFVPYILDEGEKTDTAERSEMRMVFNTDAAGDINSFQFIGIEDPKINIIFKRTQKAKAADKEQLSQYLGDYELAGTSMKFFLKGETLFASVPGQPDYELVPLEAKDKFSIKVLNGYFIQFERNDKNEVISASFIQPNGTFKATKKTAK